MKKKFLFLTILLALLIPCFAVAPFSASAQEEHTVLFMLSETETYLEVEVADGDYLSVPATPTKDGALFKHWTLNGEKFSFRTRIKEDLILIADWDVPLKIFEVKFLVDGIVVNTQKVIEGENAIAPATVECPEGKRFVGWENVDITGVNENLSVNAILEDKTYTVTVYGLDDQVLFTKEVVHGQNANLPALSEFNVEHYTAIGYKGEVEKITQDTEIFVEYQPDEYQVSFYVYQDVHDVQTVAYGEYASFPTTAPSKENYIFIGWYESLEATSMFDFYSAIDKDVDLFAKFIPIEKPKYSVRFFNYDGTQYGGTQLVEEGQGAIVPGDPYREGYEFLRWAQDFSSVTRDLDVYPIFSIMSYTVTFVDDEGEIEVQTVKYGQNAKEPDLDKIRIPEGKEFDGWDIGFKNIDKDIVVTAKFRAQTFVVIFYNGSKRVGAIQYVEYGKDAKVPVLAEKEGYDFLGWSDGETIGQHYKNITQDTILFTNYEQRTYEVTYREEVEEGSFQIIDNVELKYGETAPLKLYDKENYVFIGWYLDKEFTLPYDFSLGVTTDFMLYAKWEVKPAVTYTVEFRVDGVLYGKEQIVSEGASAIAPANPVKEGYTFKGWDKSFVEVKGDLTVNAVFEINTYKVTFEYGDKTDVQLVTYLEDAVAPTDTEREGYIFDGWNANYEKITKDMTISAVYKIKTFTVTFYNGKNVVAIQQVNYGLRASIVDTPEKMGYKFVGWTNEDQSVFDYATPIKAQTNVYAQFSPLSYNVYYYVNGMLYETQSVEYNTQIVLIDQPTYDDEDVIFSGWSEVPEIMPAQSLVVFATTYKLQYFTLSYYVDGVIYQSVQIKEGDEIVLIDAPTDIDEYIYFVEWSSAPQTMPKNNVRVDAVIKRYYQVNYYVEGNLYLTDKVLEGEEIVLIGEPSDLDENLYFVGWTEVPEIMPERAVRVDAIVKNYYQVNYFVNGDLYHTDKVLAGDKITLIGKPSNLDENLYFGGWTEVPEIMPEQSVRVDAIIRVYYQISYYVNGSLCHTDKVLAGDKITLIGAPSDIDENIFFVAWEKAPEIMPEEDIVVNAIIKRYFEVSYFVAGSIYYSEKVLEGDEITLIGAPDDLDENIFFVAWGKAPELMPSEDVRIDAVIKRFYQVNYYVDGQIYYTDKVLEGEQITLIDAPELSENQVFSGWQNAPEIMPSEDVRIDGNITTIELKDNNVVVSVSNDGRGNVQVDVEIKGKVNFAGLLGRIDFNDMAFGGAYTDEYSYAYNNGQFVKFVWSKGENTTEQTHIMTFLFDSNSFDMAKLNVIIEQMYVINEDGQIVETDFVIDYVEK